MLSPCRRGGSQLAGDEAAEADGVELRAQADDLRLGEAETVGGDVGEDIDGVRDDQHDGARFQSGLEALVENADEQVGVAVDEVEAAFIGLAAQAGGDADDVAGGNVLVAAGGDDLVGDAWCAVQQVERLSGGQLGVDIENRDFTDNAAALEGIRGGGADKTAAADDGDFHGEFMI
jgi:hypothetical protein